MIVHRFRPLLDVAAWEAALAAPAGDATAAGEAVAPGEQGGPGGTGRLHLDLSRVEWVDFGVLARALLLLDAAVRSGSGAAVTLPAPEPTRAERAALARVGEDPDAPAAERRVRRRAGRRGQALAFLRQAGFEHALRTADWPAGALTVHEGGTELDDRLAEAPGLDPDVPGDDEHGDRLGDGDGPEDGDAGGGDEGSGLGYGDARGGDAGGGLGYGDADGDDGALADPSAGSGAPQRRRILPLRWVSPLAGGPLRESGALRVLETGLREIGVSAADARAIGGTILAELIENVARHAAGTETFQGPNALVGAQLLDPEVLRGGRMRPSAGPGGPIELDDAAGGRVLRLLVGDSGAAIRDAAPDAPAGSADAADPAGMLVQALESIIAAREAAPCDGDRHGLRRVAGMVHGYQGSVTMRSGRMAAELALGRGEDAIGSVREDAGRAPGVLFEALLATDPRPLAGGAAWQAHPAVPRDLDLRWIGCELEPGLGLSRTDAAAFAAAADRARAAQANGGVVVTLSSSDPTGGTVGDYQLTLRRALETLSRGAEGTAVAAVFPDTSRQLLQLHAAQLYGTESLYSTESEAGDDEGTGGSPHPVLLFGSRGAPVWYGGRPPVRRLLESLTAADGVMPTERARKHWIAGLGDAADFDTAVRGLRHLISVDDDSLLLLLSPVTVLGSLLRTVQRVLASEIARGRGGVERGLFRTPTLALVDRWIDVPTLIASTIGFGCAGFVLARAAEAELGRNRAAGLGAVVRSATCPAPLAAALSECLGLRGSFQPLDAEHRRGVRPEPPELPEGSGVVLCADLIATENTVRRAATAVSRHAVPAVIVCVVDARAQQGPVRVLNREIPVVALARIDLTPPFGRPPDREIADIDPILHRVAQPRIEQPPPVDEDELLDLCGPSEGAQQGALRLGHFKSDRRHMHFTADIRSARLLRQGGARARIAGALAEEVRRGLDELDRVYGPIEGDPGELELRCPGGEDEDVLELAQEVLAALRDSGLPALGPIEERGAAARPAEAAPQSVPAAAAAPRQAVIIEPGFAATGTAAVRLARDAALGGAERVLVIALAGEPREQDPDTPGMIRAVPGPAGAAVPALVRFVSRSAVGGFEAEDCPVCATRAEYAEIGRADSDSAGGGNTGVGNASIGNAGIGSAFIGNAGIGNAFIGSVGAHDKGAGGAPVRLRKHAKTLSALLAARRPEEILETAPADLFDVPITHAAAADFLRWRRLLERALRDTAARQELLDRLVGLPASGGEQRWGRRALIRLLAAEQHWLKLPPLCFTACREQLARLCREELAESAPEPPWLRVQALMLLASAVPEEFVWLLPHLLALAADEQVVVDQLLLDCYRLVHRPSYDTPLGLDQLRGSLVRCRDYLEHSRAGWDSGLIEEYAEAVDELICLVDRRSRTPESDARAAWARLREEWCRPIERHRFEGRLLRVRDFVEVLRLVGPDGRLAELAQDDWEACARLVAERAAKYLPRLRHILAGDYVGRTFGPAARERLVELAGAGSTMLPATAEGLRSLAERRRQPGDVEWRAVWQDVLERINWWHLVFFATHRPNTESPALLVDLLLSTPCYLRDVLESAAVALGVAVEPAPGTDLDVRVFCPRGLLYETFEHLIKNARRHRHAGAGAQRFEISLVRTGPDRVRVTLRNTDSSPRPTPGEGIEELDRGLRPFGASLAAAPVRDGEWTFEAVITLQVWQEA